MPSLKTHCAISKKRTGKEYKELHQWIDEAHKYIDFNHRIERHSYLSDYEKYIEEKWDEKAVVEWLFHIAIDNIETANKFAEGAYNKRYDEINFCFVGKDIAGIDFTKHFKNRYGTHSYTEEDEKPARVAEILREEISELQKEIDELKALADKKNEI